MKREKNIIGLTGSIACGKNAVAAILETLGFLHIDVDCVYHEILENDRCLISKIRSCFGDTVFNDTGVDRKALGKIVYNSASKMQILTELTHPVIIEKIRRLAESSRQSCVINAALLIEMGLHRICDKVIVVDVLPEIQVQRLCMRDSINAEYARQKIESQADNSLKKKYAHHIIENNNTIETLEAMVKNLIESKGY